MGKETPEENQETAFFILVDAIVDRYLGIEEAYEEYLSSIDIFYDR